VKYFGLAIGEAGTDTSFTDIRRRSLLDIGRIRVDQFETAAVGDFKGACSTVAPRAAQALDAYLAENATQPDAFAARSNLASMYLQCGDTAKVEAVYEPVVKNPAAFGDIEATQGGVTMTRINRSAKAAALFEAALQVNPYQRDALNNLAATYYNSQKFAEMMPIVGRLVAVDPNNPDNWLWYAYAYQGLAKPLKNTDPKKKTYADSLSYYNNISETMTLKVSFNNFTRGAEETKLGGSIEYRPPQPTSAPARGPRAKAAPAKPAAPPARDVTIVFSWLDKSGATVETTQVTVAGLKPGESKDFATSVKKPGVVGYKYAKLD
jgi:tetratricopeptide (TPR) repeat protein